MVLSTTCHQGTISIVEVEKFRQLLGSRFCGIASIAIGLIVTEKCNGHRFSFDGKKASPSLDLICDQKGCLKLPIIAP
jgi:hypothetical protein